MLYILTEVLLSIAACYVVGKFFIWVQTEHENIEGAGSPAPSVPPIK